MYLSTFQFQLAPPQCARFVAKHDAAAGSVVSARPISLRYRVDCSVLASIRNGSSAESSVDPALAG